MRSLSFFDILYFYVKLAQMDNYSINDLVKLSGIKAHTIRVWERRFRIVSPHRTDTNRRRYDDNDLRRIINISILRRNGFKISRIATLSGPEIEEKVSFLSRDVFHSETLVDSLIISMSRYNEYEINDFLIRSIMNRGLEETITEVMFPVLNRIGIMWQTGSVDICAEHFVSNIFRQRIISSIDSLPFLAKPGSKKALLFLPENELHDLGLLFFSYIIRKTGHKTLYLGQTTPVSSIIDLVRQWEPDIILTSLMSGLPDINAEGFILQLAKLFPDQKILVSGTLADAAIKLKHSDIFPVRSAADLKSHL